METFHEQLDKLADEFEGDWRSGSRPQIDEYLDRVESRLVLQLQDLLIPLDIDYRQRTGELVLATDYGKFGDHCVSIAHQTLVSRHIDSSSDSPTNILESRERTLSGECVGPYKLLQPLGAGGMGEVWVAEQSAPIKRRVALKLIKTGVGSKEILARFEGERQALALMNHPNIARILDAGTTRDGQPYFVMELVQGQPLTTYCDQNRLNVDDRLRMFAEICAGVQHAHQKGIIHRDLKPGNIIVGMQDGKPVPKIIDFGLAKAIESTQRLTDQSLFTGIGQVLGTLRYMSPEQASLDAIDIDTRTDIYALGVILYELLTGSTPLDEPSIKGQAALKLLEFIREKEPVKPSSRLRSSTDAQKSAITNQRRTDSFRLNRVLTGDLDWIVMKALEKDRTRRYESASGFAADIHRFLSSEPVSARPPSLAYRFGKTVHKHKGPFLAAISIFLLLILGLIGTGTMWAMARAETEKVRQAETEASEIVDDYFTIAEDEFLNQYPSLRERLLRRAEDHYKRLAEKIDLAANSQLQLARVLKSMAYLKHSQGLVNEALGHTEQGIEIVGEPTTEHSQVLLSDLLFKQGMILREQSKYEEARTALEQAHVYMLPFENGDVDSVVRLARLKRQLSLLETNVGNSEEAEKFAREAYEIAKIALRKEDSLATRLQLTTSIGQLVHFLEREPAKAAQLEIIELLKAANNAKLSPEIQSRLGQAYRNLASFHRFNADFDSAIAAYQQATEHATLAAGLEPTASNRFDLGVTHDLYAYSISQHPQPDYALAIENYFKAIQIFQSIVLQEGPQYENALSWRGQSELGLCQVYRRTNESTESLKYAAICVETARLLSDRFPRNRAYRRSLSYSLSGWANACMVFGEYDKAIKLSQEVSSWFEQEVDQSKSPDDRLTHDYALSFNVLGNAYEARLNSYLLNNREWVEKDLHSALQAYEDASTMFAKINPQSQVYATAKAESESARRWKQGLLNLKLAFVDYDAAVTQYREFSSDPGLQQDLSFHLAGVGLRLLILQQSHESSSEVVELVVTQIQRGMETEHETIQADFVRDLDAYGWRSQLKDLEPLNNFLNEINPKVDPNQ